MKTQPPRFLSALGPPFCQLLTCDPRFKCVLPRAQEKWLLLAAFHVGSDSSGCGPPTAAVQWVHLQTLLPLPHATSTPPTTTAPALPGPVPVDLWQSESQLTSTGEWMTPGSHSTGGELVVVFPGLWQALWDLGGILPPQEATQAFVDIVPSSQAVRLFLNWLWGTFSGENS